MGVPRQAGLEPMVAFLPIEQLVPPYALRIGWVLDLPPMHAAPVGIALALGDDALEIVLLDGGEERLATTLDRHGFGE